MADVFSASERSRIMSLIRSKDTKPELRVRKYLFSLGYRYRLYNKHLPGKPDLSLKKYNTVVFVHGCFWHHHKDCKRSNWPKTNKNYWIPKIKRNIQRDKDNANKLKNLGWDIIVIWECETRDINKIDSKISKYLA